MSVETPRLRMFAGPNGSGKSTLKRHLPERLLGIYVNPDEIEAELRATGTLDFEAYGLDVEPERLIAHLAESPWLGALGRGDWSRIMGAGRRLDLSDVEVDSYLASVVSDFLRASLLQSRITFTFETVMSHPDKVAILHRARSSGYRTYLYYVATNDPAINISRVRNRVRLGGHPVPEDRIISRYHRSLEFLMDAIRASNRAYLFDNSGDSEDRNQTWVAEITDGEELVLKTDRIPPWFQAAVLSKI